MLADWHVVIYVVMYMYVVIFVAMYITFLMYAIVNDD